MDLLIVLPAYNEADTIERHVAMLDETLRADGIAYRLAVVDDGSSDATWPALLRIADAYPGTSCLRLSRNFGKEAAICAALGTLDAERYLIMDSDMQHPPSCVKGMLALMDESGADVVDGVKRSRGKERFFGRVTARLFYKLMKTVSGLELNDSSDFKLIRRPVVDALRTFGEGTVFFRGLMTWVGFVHTDYPFDVAERTGGASRFSTAKLVKLALSAILSYTSKPLYVTIAAGFAFLIGAAGLGAHSLYMYFSGRAQGGFSTVILLLLLTGSMILLSLGVIGAYVARIYNEVKARPRFIVSDRYVTGSSWDGKPSA
jgi:dolichol-phosphate mannosyltransferase